MNKIMVAFYPALFLSLALYLLLGVGSPTAQRAAGGCVGIAIIFATIGIFA